MTDQTSLDEHQKTILKWWSSAPISQRTIPNLSDWIFKELKLSFAPVQLMDALLRWREQGIPLAVLPLDYKHVTTVIRKDLMDEALDMWESGKSDRVIAEHLNEVHGTKYTAKTLNNFIYGIRRQGNDPRAVYHGVRSNYVTTRLPKEEGKPESIVINERSVSSNLRGPE